MAVKNRIDSELAVGVADEIRAAVEIASTFTGLNPTQIGRQVLVEKLCRDGFLHDSGLKYQNSTNPNAEIK